MALHQTLKNLCSKSGWCYAVFWKLKRRSRMVLTWEDGYCEFQSLDTGGSASCLESGGRPLAQGGALQDTSYSQGQIGLAVAKMSYCVYFMGEGIIGRVAFTGEHKWVFADGDASTIGTIPRNVSNGQYMLEKYPASWEVQFAAGIKTIAVIAVPQGVVQLGSTQAMMEDIVWVHRVKSAVGASQSLLGNNTLSERQGGNSGRSPLGRPYMNLSSKLQKTSVNQSFFEGRAGLPWCGLESPGYGLIGSSLVSAQSNLHKSSAVAEAVECSQNLPQKTDIPQVVTVETGSLGLRPSALKLNSQIFEAPSTASNLGLVSIPQVALSSEDYGGQPGSGDLRNMIVGNGSVQSSLVNTLGRGQVPCADSDRMATLYKKSSKSIVLKHSGTLDSRGDLSSLPADEQSSLHPKATSASAVLCSTNVMTSELSGMVGSLGALAEASQDTLSRVNKEFLGNSMVGSMPRTVLVDERTHKNFGVDPMVFVEEVGDKNLISGGDDSLQTYLASFAQEQSSKWDGSFAIGDELSQALGPGFQQSHLKVFSPLNLNKDQSMVGVDQHTLGKKSSVSGTSTGELMPTWSSNFVKSEPPFPENKPEPLLDAIVASVSSSLISVSTAADNSFSCRTFSAKDGQFPVSKVAKTSAYNHASSYSTQDCISQSFVHGVPVACETSANDQVLSKVFSGPLGFNMSSTVSPLKTILSSWAEDVQSTKRSDSAQSSQLRKPEDPAKATRKRARPGESTRPRPKDRQQIQDRVRELREIVPNGSKCSIDALLEKTIKHMLFLQNVTLHADNLKKDGELKDDVDSGASWAVDLGGEEIGHPPILVKNLSQPRQLLVEMFCEEKGHFLEIADMIRSLGLTILKGVMESRSDKIWARFVVEANRDVRRVDIMMSLMQLLHVNNSSSSITVGSQTAPLRSQQGVECSSTSQAQSQTVNGFPQPALHACQP